MGIRVTHLTGIIGNVIEIVIEMGHKETGLQKQVQRPTLHLTHAGMHMGVTSALGPAF